MLTKLFCVYILASGRRGTLYIGVTSDLRGRVFLHRTHALPGSFSDRYDVTRLVWYEVQGSAEAAIRREKQLKKWRRAWKVELVEDQNPRWVDLWESILD